MGKRILVTGPTKSGKSEWAEQLAKQSSQAVVYVATSVNDANDTDWQRRIQQHQQRRPLAWRSLEVPIELSAALATAQTDECWLVDSLGTWLANCLEQPDETWETTVAVLLKAIAAFPGTLVIVAEETGWGVVPAYPLGRTFRDRLGSLTRQIGQLTDSVYLVVAGYAVPLKQVGTPVE